MRRKVYLFIGLLVLVTVTYLFVFEWVVPKTASITIPQKWRRIPLRQPKEIVRDYFGEPLANEKPATDKWSGGSKGKMYFLRIYYLSDTIATGYSIHYQFENRLASRDYLVDTGSIR